MRATGAAAAALLALGAFLRVHGLTGHELWIDEYGTWWAVAGEGVRDVVDRVLAVQGQSPLYYLLVDASVAALGGGVLALRLPSLLCGVLLLAVAWPLAREAFGDRRMALATLAAFAVNERLIFYSQDARPYALALLCAAASFLAWLVLLRDPRRRAARIAWVLATAATFYAHYLFGVIVLVQALHGLWRWRRDALPLRPWLVPCALLALLCAPGTLQLASLFGRRHGLDWVPSSGWGEGLEVAFDYVEPPILLATAAAVAVAAIRGGLRRPLFPRGARPELVLLWAAVPFLVILSLPPLFDVTLVHRRYVLVTVPALAMLLGALMGLPAPGARLAWLPLAVFLAAVAGLGLVPQYERSGVFSERYRGEHWSRAGRVLREAHRPGEPILYRTHFVELDAVVRGEASPQTVAFTTWPIAAHLRPAQREALRALPYHGGPGTTAMLRERLREAAESPRAWIVGMRPLLPGVGRIATVHPGLRVERHERYGKVHLILMRGRGPAPGDASGPPPPGGASRPGRAP